jgi:hypothetical protein
MPTIYVDIAPRLLVEIVKGLQAEEQPRYFRVVENPVPQDAQLLDVHLVGPWSAALRLRLSTEEPFEEGATIEPVLETVVLPKGPTPPVVDGMGEAAL